MTASRSSGVSKYALCLLLVSALSGCAGMGASSSSTHYQSLPAKPPKITFVRNQNAGDTPVITTVAINDWIVGTLAPGEYLSITHEPGLHYVSVKGKTVPLTFRNNREYYFLIEQDRSGATKAIRPVYAKDAAHYMESSRYYTDR